MGLREKYKLKEHAFSSKPYTMLLAGRISKEKGQMEAVKALNVLACKGIKLKLLLVGYGIDDYYNDIKNYVKQHRLEEYVRFIQYTDDLRSLRESADIGLICSVKEAFGRVTVENFFSLNFMYRSQYWWNG